MTPEQIKELAKQAGAVINTSVNWPDVIAFGNDTLAEFARLIRTNDEALMRQALDALLDDALESRNREQISAIAALHARLEGVHNEG